MELARCSCHLNHDDQVMSRASSARVDDRILFHFFRPSITHRSRFSNLNAVQVHTRPCFSPCLSRVATKPFSIMPKRRYNVKLAMFQNGADLPHTVQPHSTFVTVHKWSVYKFVFICFNRFYSSENLIFNYYLGTGGKPRCLARPELDHRDWWTRSWNTVECHSHIWIPRGLSRRQCCLKPAIASHSIPYRVPYYFGNFTWHSVRIPNLPFFFLKKKDRKLATHWNVLTQSGVIHTCIQGREWPHTHHPKTA